MVIERALALEFYMTFLRAKALFLVVAFLLKEPATNKSL